MNKKLFTDLLSRADFEHLFNENWRNWSLPRQKNRS